MILNLDEPRWDEIGQPFVVSVAFLFCMSAFEISVFWPILFKHHTFCMTSPDLVQDPPIDLVFNALFFLPSKRGCLFLHFLSHPDETLLSEQTGGGGGSFRFKLAT